MYTQWLINLPKEMRVQMANAYIETMELDVASLRDFLQAETMNTPATLRLVHKIKGGTMQIGLKKISQLAVYTEELGRLTSPDYPRALTLLVKEIQQSITDVQKWINHNTSKQPSTKLYSY